MSNRMSFSNSTTTISFILNSIATVDFGGLDLQPTYQRGYIWSDDFKDKLIFSIIKAYPIGNVSVRVLNNNQTNYKGAKSEVVDGQQRLTTIRDFKNGSYVIQGEWSRKIILEIQSYFENAGKTDTVLDKLLKRLNNKGNIKLKFSDLPDVIKGNFDNYNISMSYIADATDEQIREYFRFLQNQERLRAGEIINSMPPTKLEKYLSSIENKDKVLDIIGFSDDRKEFDKIFYSIIGLLDGKIPFGTTDKAIQNYAVDAEEIIDGKTNVLRMIQQLNYIAEINKQIINISRKRFLKFLLLLMSLGYIDFTNNTEIKLKNLATIDDKLSVFFSAKSGAEATEFTNYSVKVIEELRLIALLSKGGHPFKRVDNRMKMLAYYINNVNENNTPSNIKLIENSYI